MAAEIYRKKMSGAVNDLRLHWADTGMCAYSAHPERSGEAHQQTQGIYGGSLFSLCADFSGIINCPESPPQALAKLSGKRMMGGDPHFFCRRWGPQFIPFITTKSLYFKPVRRWCTLKFICKKKWKKLKKIQKKWVGLLTLFRWRYIFSITVATLSCDSRTKQKVLWQIREGNNWLNNFYMFLYNQRTKTYPRVLVLKTRLINQFSK